MEGPDCCCHPCGARALTSTTKVQDEVASFSSHLLSHLLSSQIRCRQPPAPEQAGKVAMKDDNRFCSLRRHFPYSLWYSTRQNHQVRVGATSTVTSPSGAAAQLPALQMVAVGCEAGFQHVPTGKCAACHMAWLLRDAKESGPSRESLPPAVEHGAQCTTPTTTTTPAAGQGRSKTQPSASIANKPLSACQHVRQLTLLPRQDSHALKVSSCPAARVIQCWIPPCPSR